MQVYIAQISSLTDDLMNTVWIHMSLTKAHSSVLAHKPCMVSPAVQAP